MIQKVGKYRFFNRGSGSEKYHRGYGSPKLNRAHLIMQKMLHCAIKYLLLKKHKKGVQNPISFASNNLSKSKYITSE